MTKPRFVIIEAPSVLGLFPKGVETLPGVLLSAGLAEQLNARRAGRIESLPYDNRRDPETTLLNSKSIAAFSTTLADSIGQVFESGEFPVVLGGDCSIVLGCVLAMRRRGRSGLLYLDGHADFYQPEGEPNGEAASMVLALATARGPEVITNLENLRPLVRDEDVVLLARRDAEDAEQHGSQRVEDTSIEVIDLAAVRRDGPKVRTRRALERLASSNLDGFWIHIDADVLDDAIMPAVDYRLPGGLHWGELTAILRTALASGRAHGLDVTIFNPKLDSDGLIARRFVDTLAEGLLSRSS